MLQQVFQVSSQDTMIALEDAVAKNEALLLDKACVYLDKYYLFFLKGLDWLEQTRAQIVDYQFLVSEVCIE